FHECLCNVLSSVCSIANLSNVMTSEMNAEDHQNDIYDKKYFCDFDNKNIHCSRSRKVENIGACENSFPPCQYLFRAMGSSCALGSVSVNTIQNITAVQWSESLNGLFAEPPITENESSKNNNLPLILGTTLGAAFVLIVIFLLICCRKKLKRLCVRVDTVYNVNGSTESHIYDEIIDTIERSVHQVEDVSCFEVLNEVYSFPIDRIMQRRAEMFQQGSLGVADLSSQPSTSDHLPYSIMTSINANQPSLLEESGPSQQLVNDKADDETVHLSTSGVEDDHSSQPAPSDQLYGEISQHATLDLTDDYQC
ncbi:hypothetical protein BgiMline_019855, partial [Biomphalaria glabrata]